MAVLCLVFGVVLALGQAVVARHRAAGGADLAALVAADHWADGAEGACARARDIAGAQGTRLVRCVLTGRVSDVTAAAGRGPFAAEVRARAGPPEEDPMGVPGSLPGRVSVVGPKPPGDRDLWVGTDPWDPWTGPEPRVSRAGTELSGGDGLPVARAGPE
ncbi:Rv3654c family TadE-like protein [Streptomyces sp. SHP 1-2]|uniref:Rv3654c family TadE-like protein n=1 Tax=Streptomyces sp. SHP 1-2 TaxID=2769489 RepID=UPI0039DF6A85